MKNVIKNNRKVSVSLTITKSKLDEVKKISQQMKESASGIFEQAIEEYLERQLIKKLVDSYSLHPVNKEWVSERAAWQEFDIEERVN